MSRNQNYRILDLESKNVTDTQTAIEEAGLNWDVKDGRLRGECFDRESMEYVWRDLQDHKVVYRKDTGMPLGNAIVGKNFHLVQNREAFATFDKILKQENVQFLSGGWYWNGAGVFLQAKLPSGVLFDNGDQLERHLLISQGHTGQQAIKWAFTHHRPSCLNTLMAAVRDSTYTFSLKHTSGCANRFEEAIKFMSQGLTHLEKTERKMHIMSKLHLSEAEQINFLKLAYDRPIDEDLKDWRNWQKLEPIFYSPRGGEFSKGTLWNPYNVVTEYEDHHRRVNREPGQSSQPSDDYVSQSRRVRAMFGPNTINRKLRAFNLANQVVEGNLDLRTGKKRDEHSKREFVAITAGIVAATAIQATLPF